MTDSLFEQWIKDRVVLDNLNDNQAGFLEECWEWTNKHGPANCWAGDNATAAGMIRGLLIWQGKLQMDLAKLRGEFDRVENELRIARENLELEHGLSERRHQEIKRLLNECDQWQKELEQWSHPTTLTKPT